MWCPILRLSNRAVWKCAKEVCAWWDEGAERCAVLVIAEKLYQIMVVLDSTLSRRE